MSPSLMDKLRMIDTASPAKHADAPVSEPEGAYQRRDRFPLSTFSPFRHATAENLSDIFGMPFPRAPKPSDWLFLDTETTGLSGGAGTLAFQVGLGYFERDAFVTEQFCMRDYPDEPGMLALVAERLRAYPVLITFNGRTFDVPLLKSRMLINRLDARCLDKTHLDVLYPARRLWKLRLGSCSLGRLEEAVLGVSREDDLPGALVPQTYFQYLRDRDFAPVLRVMEHNRQDVVSLAQLFLFLCEQYDRPEGVSEALDLYAMARALERRGGSAKATKCYRLCARGETRAQSFAAMARNEKRQGNVQNAVRLYAAMARRDDDPVWAAEQLAMLYEHQLRDVEQALAYTRQALLLLSEPSLAQDASILARQDALRARYARLRRRRASI